MLLAEGNDVIPGAAGLVEVGAEDLALEDGDFVEGEDHFGLGVRGDWFLGFEGYDVTASFHNLCCKDFV